jgi:glutaminyl-peptide cyclotransferase
LSSSSIDAREPAGPRGLMSLVRMQTSLGPRVPGSEAHDRLRDVIQSRLESSADATRVQRFRATFGGRTVECANIAGFFGAKATAAAGISRRRSGALLLGTHYDTRPRADRERDPVKRENPIPGANDGGSGTAILLDLLGKLGESELKRDVAVVFFDAEDLGNIDGNQFSLGAEYLASHPLDGFPGISEVLVLDMVGGRDMILDIDANAMRHEESFELTRRVFEAGEGIGGEPFLRSKRGRVKCIVCDHWPFLRRGIPSCILIDIDYPEWHTHDDLPEAMSERSLCVIEEAISLFLTRPRD